MAERWTVCQQSAWMVCREQTLRTNEYILPTACAKHNIPNTCWYYDYSGGDF